MAKTITISLPDSMYDRFINVKSEFNVSRVCQEAIMEKVEIIEKAKDATTVIDFLKAGKEETAKADVKLGRNDALSFIKDKFISYNMFIEVVKAIDDLEDRSAPPGFYFNTIPDEISGEVDCYIREAEKGEGKNVDVDAYCRGFCLAIHDYWEEVQQEL